MRMAGLFIASSFPMVRRNPGAAAACAWRKGGQAYQGQRDGEENHRVVKESAFTELDTMEALAEELFGGR